jgi:predicted dehydrogenase
MAGTEPRRRYAIAGTGARAEMFIRGITGDHAAELVALCDRNPLRAVISLPEHSREGHGGANERMLAVLLGAAKDPMDRSATAHDGAQALLTGLAANRSMDTGAAVHVTDLLDLTEPAEPETE